MWPKVLFCLIIFYSEVVSLKVHKCGTFPSTLDNPTAIYDGKNDIYIIGGQRSSSMSDEILKLNIINSTLQVAANFPYGVVDGVAAINDNGDIFYLGGKRSWASESGNPSPTQGVFKILNGSSVEVAGKLPTSRYTQSSVRVGDAIYIFGGDNSIYTTSGTREIEEFNITTKTARVVAYLPKYIRATSAVYDGQDVYIFGGHYGGDYGKSLDEIVRFNPKTFEVEIITTRLPTPISGSSAVMVGKLAYIIGGDRLFKSIIVFDTTNQTISTIPVDRSFSTGASSVYVESQRRIYVFGGYMSNSFICIDFRPMKVDCAKAPDGVYVDPFDCSKFIMCSNGKSYSMDCPKDLFFNPEKLFCDYPSNVICP